MRFNAVLLSLLLALLCSCVVAGASAVDPSATPDFEWELGNSVVSGSYHQVNATYYSLYQYSLAVASTNWTCNITFPLFAWNSSYSSCYFWLAFAEVRPFNTTEASVDAVNQSAVVFKLYPHSAQSVLSYFVNSTEHILVQSTTWNNGTVSAYCYGSALTVSYVGGAYNASLAFAQYGVSTLKPVYLLYYWSDANAYGSCPISAGSIKFSFWGLSSLGVASASLGLLLGVVVSIAVVSLVFQKVERL